MLQSIRDGNSLIVRLTGELDHCCAQSVRRELDGLIADRTVRWLILDFSHLQFMDSSGIGLIMGRYRMMQMLGGQLHISGASERLWSIMRLAGLERLPIVLEEGERK